MATSNIQPLITSYEWPPDCGGGGRVASTLVDGLETWGIEPIVHDDHADGHFLTFPARSHAELQNLTEFESPDLIHAQFSLPTALLLPRIARDYDVPLVITVMGSDIYNPRRFTRIRPVLDRVNAWILDQADYVCAPSHELAGRVKSLTDTRCKVVPHGIDVGQYDWRPRELNDTVNILTVSRFAKGKNIGLAIEAVERLQQCYDIDVQHRVVGDGPTRLSLLREHGDKDYLTLPGWDEDTKQHYDWADLFYLPSEWEAFGLVFLEALASGLPCVTTPNGGQAEIVTDDVGYTAEPTVNDQVDALNYTIQWYPELQANTMGYVKDWYSKRNMIRQYHNLYLKLC